MEEKRKAEIFSPERRYRRYLINILQDIQACEGYLSREMMEETAGFLGIYPAEVWGVATFYNQFRLSPPGRNPVRVCMGTACHLAGGQLVLEAMVRELKIEIGATSEDGEFSLERVACIGCCALAPAVTIGENIYPKMTPPKVEEVLVQIKPEGDGRK